LTYTLSGTTRSGRRWADGVWRPPTVSGADAAEAAAAEFAGWVVSISDEPLAEALSARGAIELRHVLVMSRSLRQPVPPGAAVVCAADGMTVWPLSAQQLIRHSRELGELHYTAYPPGHPDHRHLAAAVAADELLAIARGEILGPLMPQSRVAVAKRAIVGACLLVDRPGQAPEGGPWVIDIFRDPDSPLTGIGKALLTDVLSASRTRGLPALSLVVSHRNVSARNLYAELGFTVAEESWILALPASNA